MFKYDSIHEDLVAAFPELGAAKDKLYAAWAPDKPGPYIIFEDIFRRYVELLLLAPASEGRWLKLNDIFSFIEKLLTSGSETESLDYISQLESQSAQWHRLAKPFLGPGAISMLDEHELNWRDRMQDAHSRIEPIEHQRYNLDEVVIRVLEKLNRQ